MRTPRLLAPLAFAAVLLPSVYHRAFADTPRQNLARGAAYECVVPPNYWGWKNPQHGDRGQLTDGAIVETWSTEQGLIYSLPSSIGWSAYEPVVIFDLGEVRSIGGIGLHTVNSVYGPWWPDTLDVLVSDDNEHYYLAGSQTITPGRLTPPVSPQAYQAGIDRTLADPTTHWYRGAFTGRGRYVALVMSLPPSTGTIVMDEVEIYPGPQSQLDAPRPEPVFTEGRAGVQSFKLRRAINERITRDAAALRVRIERAAAPPADRQALLARLADVLTRVEDQPIPPVAEFRAVYPISDLHRELFALHAALWRAQGAAPLRAWKTHRWDPLSPFDDPGAGQEPSLSITLAQNAVRSGVVNLSNSTDGPLTVQLRPRDLPAESLDLFEVVMVDTQKYEPVASAMIALAADDGAYRLSIPAGMTRQVWVRCTSGELEAGRYEGAIAIETHDDSQAVADVPVAIDVASVRLPDRLSLYLGGWDYPLPGTYEVTAENVEQYVAILHEYGVNVTWGSGYMGRGEYDAAGNLVSEPSRDEADQWLSRWPDAALYCVVAGGLHTWPAGEVAAWARDWSSYMSSRGVGPQKIAILLQDEPISAEEFEMILTAGRAIRQGEPKFRVFNDIHVADPMNQPPVLDDLMREACDIQCFNVGFFFDNPGSNEAFMEKYDRPGLQWWCYTGGQADRLSDPYVAWLLRPWFCFDKGLTGAHWWAFGDGNAGFSWNEYFNPGPGRSPLYLARDSVTPSKSMEAMREGAQDYELLRMLRDTGDPAAGRLIEQGVARVLQSHNYAHWPWNKAKDRSVADEVRIQVLNALAQ